MSASTSQHSLSDQMAQLIAGLAKALVDLPDEVAVVVHEEAAGTLLRLRVAPGDLGKVIGKQGRTARSIRTVLAAASMKAHHRFSLDIQQEQRPGAPGNESEAEL